VVPLFQRAYVWTEEEWEALWENIEDQAHESLDAMRAQRLVETSHFLGAIVVNVAKVVAKGLSRSEIIDGQQRLTTLQVFLAALRDCARERDGDLADKVDRLTRNPGNRLQLGERFKVWPTKADRDSFVQVMSAEQRESLVQLYAHTGMPRIGQAYMFFSDRIARFVAGCQDSDPPPEPRPVDAQVEHLEALHHALQTALQFVVIELEERDDPQVIFETLNHLGQPLLPSDLIRNFIFLEAANAGSDIDRLYTDY
jgi:uncharacterized protein with ParB-like and HNH nuclease domain